MPSRETIKDGFKNVVELTRNDLENAKHIGPVPVKEIETNKSTRQHSGTTIRVSDFHTLKRADTRGAVTELKRALNKYLERHFVFVNSERIRYEEPDYSQIYKYLPPRSLSKEIGLCELNIKVAKAPLEENMKGVSITTNEWLVETTLAGLEGKPFTELLFGEIEIPMLDEESSKVKAFDNTRTLRLNRNNELVNEILEWIKECIEEVRIKIADENKKNKETEEMKRLQEEARKIEEILNDDYDEYRHELIRANPGLGGDTSPDGSGDDRLLNGVKYVDGNTIAVNPTITGEVGGSIGGESNPGGGSDPRQPSEGDSHWGSGVEVDNAQLNKDEKPGRAKKKHGGFQIDYRNETENANRSRYIADERLIIINLDHPQVTSMKEESGVEGRLFQMITHEIAFTEYALAIVNELAERGIRVYDAFDALVHCREIIDRISKRAAAVYIEKSHIQL